ncbi:YceI family protein [Pseudofulvibacter geojedonensis]|uniref:YceI family protein n=1 Tax=Pseudofulvibacter geojedonensis TaxID=1123758 RepID=A0ABW3HZH4_9FLAO
MKKNIAIAFLTCGLLLACKNEPKAAVEDAKEVKEIVTTHNYTIKPDSKIFWQANKIVGGHTGSFSAEEGILKFEGENLKGGKVTFPIKTLKVTDIPETEESYGKLVGHLLSPDFFDMEKYSNATFEITNVEGNKITGNLNLKGITKSISFDAIITHSEDLVQVSSNKFTIDRTLWGIEYNSGKIADPAELGDYLIKDDVEIKIDVKASKS